MATLIGLFRFITCKKLTRNTNVMISCMNNHVRTLADTPHNDTSSKEVAVQGTENDEQLRVRRARAADVPRVLKFMREHASTVWPGLLTTSSVPNVVMCDYVARALAQGHSMVAEQLDTQREWSEIKGLAIGAAVCPWDAGLLERWARCVTCMKSRRLMFFTAHCLRAPALHDKYRIHNILQVILIVPKETPHCSEVVQILTKTAIQRGRDVGFPLLRFDVTDVKVAKSLEEMQLKKEWHLAYDIIPDANKETDMEKSKTETPRSAAAVDTKKSEASKEESSDIHYITVFSVNTQDEQQNNKKN